MKIFYSAFYSQVLIMVIGLLTLSWVLILYRKAQYDKISIIALILFVIVFILDFSTMLYKYVATKNNLILDFLTAFFNPLTLAMTMTVLYFFIFELARIRLLLLVDNFEKKLKRLYIIRGTCIFLTFTAVALISIINLDFSLPEDRRFLTSEWQQGLRITSGLSKLIVDTYIYWSLS